MQISILNGIYASPDVDLRTSYPNNMMPVVKKNGISAGYLRPAEGITQFGTGLGVDRGGIVWRGVMYRVMGLWLVRIDSDGTCTEICGVGGSGQVSFDYSFDRLAVAAAGRLFYYNGTTASILADPDAGTTIDFVWVDGYFLMTDGTSLIVTELNDPTAVNPLKYGSSERDPDDILGVLKLRGEVYALNRHTIEAFDNVGGDLFPFSRIEGAQLQKGVLGTHTACVFVDRIAFLGSGRNEPPAVWIGANGQAEKLSTREIDTILLDYTEAELALVLVEARCLGGQELLYIHFPDKTLVYDYTASNGLEDQVWFILHSGLLEPTKYRARNFNYCYDQWICGDPDAARTGLMDSETGSHYGEMVSWDFGTSILYGEGRGAIIHELELVALPGRYGSSDAPVIWTSYSLDGVTWSQERTCMPGRMGNRSQRINWLQQGMMRNFRIQKFRGTSDNHTSFIRLEARVEGLNG